MLFVLNDELNSDICPKALFCALDERDGVSAVKGLSDKCPSAYSDWGRDKDDLMQRNPNTQC